MPASPISQAKWPATIGFTTGITALVSTVPTTFALDKVYASAIITLGTLCCFLFVLPRLPLPGFLLSRSGHEERGYSTVPLGDLNGSPRSQSPIPQVNPGAEYPASLRRLRLCFLGLVMAVCCRVEILRLTVAHVECSGANWSPMTPLVFALGDYWIYAQHRRASANYSSSAGFLGRLLQSPSIPVWTSAALAIAGTAALSAATGPRSTYICPVTSPFYTFTPAVQHVGTFLDIVIIICLHVVSQSQDGPYLKGIGAPRFATISYAAIVSGTLLAMIGSFVYLSSPPDDRYDIRRFHHLFLYSTLAFSAISSFTLLCGIVVVHHFGVVSTVVFATTASVLSSATSFVLGHRGAYPRTRNASTLATVSLIIVAFAFFSHNRGFFHEGQIHSGKASSRAPVLQYSALFTIFAIHAGLWLFQPAATFPHPLNGIITDSEVLHETFAAGASSSKSLSAASEAYRKRYGRHPPPHFDDWYSFATNRSSQIIDIFDGLHDDILPFWSLSPQEVRERTWAMIATPYNEAGAISIRDGVATVHEGVHPTHGWMLDGVVDIIKNFSEFLPDMDLAFNINDECRVAVPHRVINPMRTAATRELPPAERPRNSFSADRESQWKALPDPPIPESESPLVEMSWKKIFYQFGTTGCPPQSPSRRQRLWDVSQLCTSCAAPHSTQGFLRDWTKAGDPCHQPDLANLHGVYLAPSAFKSTNELYPVFSQSKVTGFNDILYPSAWNYLEKAKYEPSAEHPDLPFEEKSNSLFWRGATSEGLSAGKSQWQGMARQRFVHMTNGNYTAKQDLLATSNADSTAMFYYKSVSGQDIIAGLSADVQIVNDIVRCHPRDCDQQAAEFDPLAGPMDFQDHWKYKYLLDLDGAGFSGRFLPFLRSGSLPFKAGLFREWWADRVTAWQHFVPLDVRGHGLWDTLAYFAGFEAPELDIHMRGNTERAEKIATQGQEWANQVLRKEDMEIYFFRLLLEWGRLTDDDRDSIGYFG